MQFPVSGPRNEAGFAAGISGASAHPQSLALPGERLVLQQAVRFIYELGFTYLAAVLLGLVAIAVKSVPWLFGEEALQLTIPQVVVYVPFGALCFVFGSGTAAGRRWGPVATLVLTSLAALRFAAGALLDLLLLPYSLSHLILCYIFLTLVVGSFVRCAQGVGVLSRIAARNAGGFAVVLPAVHVPQPPHDDRGVAA
jgi:hypothetical protein